jgi:predicted dehydrogenase
VTKTELRLGLIGAGAWGRNLIRSFERSPRAAVTGICDHDPAQLSVLGTRRTSLSLTTDPMELIGRDDVDAVVIATPAETHVPLALEALDRGQHVFVEKPMALSASHAALLCARATERSRKLMVGHVLLYHAAVSQLVDCVRDGELGEIVRVHTRRFSASPRSRPEGPWWSLAPHDLSVMRHVIGADPTTISVVSRGDCTTARLSFARGTTGTIEVALRAPSDVRLVVVAGTRRCALFDDRGAGVKLTLFDASGAENGPVDPFRFRGAPRRVFPMPDEAPLDVEARRFVEFVLDDRPVPSDGWEGYAVTSILAAGAASLAAHGAIFPVAPLSGTLRSGNLEGLPHGPSSLAFDSLL